MGARRRNPVRRTGPKLQAPLLCQFYKAAPRVASQLPCDKRAQAWQEALLRALILAMPAITPRLLTGTQSSFDGRSFDRHDKVALSSIGALLRRCCDDSSSKRLSGELRQWSVASEPTAAPFLGGTLSLRGLSGPSARRVLFQLSRFGRAGPYPTKEAEQSSLDQHRVDLTRVFKVPKRHLRALQRFAERWAHGKVGNGRASYSSSAGFEESRSGGGWRVAIGEMQSAFRKQSFTLSDAYRIGSLVQPWVAQFAVWTGRNGPGVVFVPGERSEVRESVPAEEIFFLWDPQYAELGYTLDTWEVQREHLFAVASCVWAAYSDGALGGTRCPKCRRVTVRERGAKVRVVTPLESHLAFLGSYLNAWLLDLLSKDPRVNPYEEPKGPAWQVPEGSYLRSADLSRASDLVPAPVAGAIAKGLARGLGLGNTSVEQALAIFAKPFDVVERDGTVWRTTGAPLMGAGPTWPVLSLYNLWLSSTAFQTDCVRIVGDDLFALGSLMSSQLYDALLKATGGSVSEAKDTFSPYAGCLVERLCVVEAGRLHWYDTVSVGSLAGTSRVERDAEMLPAWARGPGMKWVPGVDYLMESTFGDEFARLRRAGFDPYIPREFGGPGFPCSPERLTASLQALRPHWVRALRVVMSQGSRSGDLLLRLQSPWKASSLTRHQDLADWVRQAISASDVERLGALPESGLPQTSLRDFERLVEAGLASGFDLARGFPVKREWELRLSVVRTNLRTVLRAVNRLVPRRRFRDGVRNIEEGLAAFLTKIRGYDIVIPAEFRTTPGIGAATVDRR